MGGVDDEIATGLFSPPSGTETENGASSSHAAPRRGGRGGGRGRGARGSGTTAAAGRREQQESSPPSLTPSSTTTSRGIGRPAGSKNVLRSPSERRALPDRASRVRSFAELENGPPAVSSKETATLRSPAKRRNLGAASIIREMVQMVEDKRDGMDAQYIQDVQERAELRDRDTDTIEVDRLSTDRGGQILDEDVLDLDEDEPATTSSSIPPVIMQHISHPLVRASSSTGHGNSELSATVDSPEQIIYHQFGDDMWPVYREDAVDFAFACEIIMNSVRVPQRQLCHSAPQTYTNNGTFVVDLSNFSNRHEVAMDGLGQWGKPQGSARLYRYRPPNGAAERVDPGEAYDVKVLCNRYVHPGTNDRQGRFTRKIYTAIVANSDTAGFGPFPLAVIVYEWIGQPHTINVYESSSPVRAAQRPFGNRSWEMTVDEEPEEGPTSWNGCPLFAKCAVDFATVEKIILGAMIVSADRICTTVPQGYRLDGTFVIDMQSVSDTDLRKDGHGSWSKPSGCSRYFKLDRNSNDAIRVDRGHQMPTPTIQEYDIQILSKRYEHDHPSAEGRFVRKIYIGKSRQSKHLQSCCTLAVVTYFWKGGNPLVLSDEGIDTAGTTERANSRKREFLHAPSLSGNDGPMPLDELMNDVPRLQPAVEPTKRQPAVHMRAGVLPKQGARNSGEPLSGMPLTHTDHLKRLTLAKELENQNRLAAILERAEAFLDRFEAIGMALAMGRSTSRLPTMPTGMGEEVDEFVDGGEVDNGNQVEETMMWDVPVTEEMEQNNETGVVGGRQPVVIDQGHAVNRNNRQPPASTNIQYTASGSMGTSGFSLPATVRYR